MGKHINTSLAVVKLKIFSYKTVLIRTELQHNKRLVLINLRHFASYLKTIALSSLFKII